MLAMGVGGQHLAEKGSEERASAGARLVGQKSGSHYFLFIPCPCLPNTYSFFEFAAGISSYSSPLAPRARGTLGKVR